MTIKPCYFRLTQPKIDNKLCQKHYRCYIYCPRDAVEIGKDGYPKIQKEKCDGCLICLRECPVGAIIEEREK